MSEANEKKLRKLACEQMYVELDISIEECSKVIGVCDKTIYRWISKGKWNEKKTETQALEKLINVNLKRALVQGLKSFANDPTNKDLQSLVSLLKQFKEQNKPSVAYKDNIIKFLDRATDYFLECGDEYLANGFKRNVVKLAEYLLARN